MEYTACKAHYGARESTQMTAVHRLSLKNEEFKERITQNLMIVSLKTVDTSSKNGSFKDNVTQDCRHVLKNESFKDNMTQNCRHVLKNGSFKDNITQNWRYIPENVCFKDNRKLTTYTWNGSYKNSDITNADMP